MKTRLLVAIVIQVLFILSAVSVFFVLPEEGEMGMAFLVLLLAGAVVYNGALLFFSLLVWRSLNSGRNEKYVPLIYFLSILPLTTLGVMGLFYMAAKP